MEKCVIQGQNSQDYNPLTFCLVLWTLMGFEWGEWEGMGSAVRPVSFKSQVLLLTSHVNLGQFPTFSESRSPYLSSGRIVLTPQCG